MTARPARSRSAIEVPRPTRISVLALVLNGKVWCWTHCVRSNGFGRALCAVRHLVPNKEHEHRRIVRSVLSRRHAVPLHSRVTQRSVWRGHCTLAVGGKPSLVRRVGGRSTCCDRTPVYCSLTSIRSSATDLVRAVANLFQASATTSLSGAASCFLSPSLNFEGIAHRRTYRCRHPDNGHPCCFRNAHLWAE